MSRFADLPATAAEDLEEAVADLTDALAETGGSTITWQLRSLGRTGRQQTWVDGAPLEDDGLESHLAGRLVGPAFAMVDTVWESERRFVITTTVTVSASGETALELDPTTKPDGETFNSAQAYLDNLASFPRDGEDVPVWMRPVLARWGAWDPDAGRLTVDDQYRPDGVPVEVPDVEVDFWLPYAETPDGPRRAHGYGDGNVGPGHTVATPDELAAWRRANT